MNSYGRGWIEEVLLVLWSMRTTPNRATDETPFTLVYGAEAVILSELSYGSPRVKAFNEATQGERRRDDVNFLEEIYCREAVRAARYQQELCRNHSRRIHPHYLEVGDLVLRRLRSRQGANNISRKWEGPYRVVLVTRPGYVRVETDDGEPVTNSWNIKNL